MILEVRVVAYVSSICDDLSAGCEFSSYGQCEA